MQYICLLLVDAYVNSLHWMYTLSQVCGVPLRLKGECVITCHCEFLLKLSAKNCAYPHALANSVFDFVTNIA